MGSLVALNSSSSQVVAQFCVCIIRSLREIVHNCGLDFSLYADDTQLHLPVKLQECFLRFQISVFSQYFCSVAEKTFVWFPDSVCVCLTAQHEVILSGVYLKWTWLWLCSFTSPELLNPQLNRHLEKQNLVFCNPSWFCIETWLKNNWNKILNYFKLNIQPLLISVTEVRRSPFPDV